MVNDELIGILSLLFSVLQNSPLSGYREYSTDKAFKSNSLYRCKLATDI